MYIYVYVYIYVHAFTPPHPPRPRLRAACSIGPRSSFLITLGPRVQWFKSLCALNTSPLRNRFTFLRSTCSLIETWAQVLPVVSPQLHKRTTNVIFFGDKKLLHKCFAITSMTKLCGFCFFHWPIILLGTQHTPADPPQQGLGTALSPYGVGCRVLGAESRCGVWGAGCRV